MNKDTLWYDIKIALIVAVIIFLIFMIKAVTFSGYDSIIYFYTLLITTFMLSRVVGSYFYKPMHLEHLSGTYEPTISFVIPCKNEEGAIYHTIEKCFEVDYPLNKMEVIAINDGSTDNTYKEMLRAKEKFGQKLILVNWEKNRGKREGMAEGFRRANGEIVIQLDSDSYPRKDSVKKLVRPFILNNIGAVVGHTLPSNKNENAMTRMQTAYYFMSFRALKATESIFGMVFCCSGCFSAYRKNYVIPILDDWLKEKFLGKTITFGDDRALSNQMLNKGYDTIYQSSAEAYTVVPNTLKKFLKQQVRWKKGWFINSIKALRFVMKRDKFVSITYFIPLIIITMITLFIAFKALVYNPVVHHQLPIYYILGIMLVALLCFLHYHSHSEERKYGKYMFLWSILNMTILSYIMIYALYDLRNMAWGTR